MQVCSFCGRSMDEVEILMISKKSKNTFICDQCVNKSSNALIEYMKSKKRTEKPSEIKPSVIYDKLNEYVIGQEEAKKTLSVALYNHMKRLNDSTGKISKSNILIAGPSGSGKTLLAKTLAEIADVPIAIADATSLTEAGYAGDDVESIIIKLIMAANGDMERAEQGIIYIDEIDKIAGVESNTKAGKRNPSGDGVQYALLKLIEGSIVGITAPGTHPMQQKKIFFDTSKILFICGGAFEGMFERATTKGIGFASELSVTEAEKDMDTDNLKKFGMRSEFLGRLPIHVKLNELTEPELVRILTEPKHALVEEYKELFAKDGIELEFTPEALVKIARRAIESNVGARGLRSIMEETMMDIMFEAPNHNEYQKIVITDATIDTKKPEIVYKIQECYNN